MKKIFRFIASLLLPYDWAYKSGFIDGQKKSNYFKGYADGFEKGIKLTVDNFRQFINKKNEDNK